MTKLLESPQRARRRKQREETEAQIRAIQAFARAATRCGEEMELALKNASRRIRGLEDRL